MIRVLLVDDHPVVRAGYARLLEQAGDMQVVAEAGCAQDGYAAYLREAPALTITDLSLPGIGGLELIRRILARDDRARVLVFSMHDSRLLVRRALDAGACGFVSKGAAPECLVDAVRRVHRGQRYLSDDVAIHLHSREAAEEGLRLASLTAREFELFRLIAQGRSLSECARVLNLSLKTVANYQTAMREKLGVETSAGLALLALRHGILQATA